jgi:hypothetical protein
MPETVDYCRELEAYLCRKNGGHLVRIVGPAFETVRAWAEQGVPLKIAFRGIDRCCERAQARGGRRRPMRIEFCEADVLAVFDDWRRALGVSASQVSESAEDDDLAVTSRKGTLATHIERSVTRLLAVRSTPPDPKFDAAITSITAELDRLAEGARKARGEARDEVITRLSQLDTALLRAARGRVDTRTAEALRAEAEAELAGFASRMSAEALARSRELAFQRLLRDALNLPVLTFD